jgi:hypothetical protein
MRFIGPTSVLTVYSNDERPYQAIGTGYDMEKSM